MLVFSKEKYIQSIVERAHGELYDYDRYDRPGCWQTKNDGKPVICKTVRERKRYYVECDVGLMQIDREWCEEKGD